MGVLCSSFPLFLFDMFLSNQEISSCEVILTGPCTAVPPHTPAKELATCGPKALICSCFTLNFASLNHLIEAKIVLDIE